ncbi:MAG: divalent metal cation transporter [Candidatus Portnoybacteria bacterium]|nr:divalent metal cation transporter [Candidatus Portnoybacteria bacterium]MDD4982945.1 divalent metal cation transporter [Candidatus Portnoybacteria bacterium]
MLHYFLKPIKRFRRSYLPGIITASADDDPSSISTYSVIGATTGFSQLWLLLVSTPLLIAIHQITARIGDVTKKGLITLIKEHFGRRVALLAVLVLVVANLLTLVADIIGMAAGFQLLTSWNYIYFIVPLIIFVWYVIVFDSYKKIARYFFWFAGIILAYFFAGILAKPDWGLIFKSIIYPPIKFNIAYFMAALGLIGTSFSPYAFFWQTEQEIEEARGAKQISSSSRAVVLGFIYSALAAFFVIVASASVMLKTDINILTVKDIARALAPVAGPWATKLFGLGLIGSGILAIPILAVSSAYGIAEFFKLPEGLNRKPSQAKGFYGMITFGFVFCLAALLFDLNPIKALFYSQVMVGAITPVIIYLILRLAREPKVMGNFCCTRLSVFGGWLTMVLLVLGDVLLFYYLFTL